MFLVTKENIVDIICSKMLPQPENCIKYSSWTKFQAVRVISSPETLPI